MAVGKKQGFQLKDFNEIQKRRTMYEIVRFSNICRTSSYVGRTMVVHCFYNIMCFVFSILCNILIIFALVSSTRPLTVYIITLIANNGRRAQQLSQMISRKIDVNDFVMQL